MATRLRLLGAEGGAEAVGAAKGGSGRFVVKLTGLGQIGLLIEVVDLEERRRAFASRRGKDRCVAEDEAALVEEVPDGSNDLVTDPQDRVLSPGPQPEMAVIHQKLDAVLLRADRIVMGQLDDAQGPHIQFVDPRSFRMLARHAGEEDR